MSVINGCGVVLEMANHLRLAKSSTISLVQQKYGALSTYPIGKDIWKPMRVSSSAGCRSITKVIRGRSYRCIQNLI